MKKSNINKEIKDNNTGVHNEINQYIKQMNSSLATKVKYSLQLESKQYRCIARGISNVVTMKGNEKT